MKAFQVRITVRENPRSPQVVEQFEWTNMTFEHLKKWNWYFEYRAALLKVKYPRFDVRKDHSQHEAEGVTEEVVKRRRIASGKAQVTKAKNRLEEWLKKQREADPMGLFDPTSNTHYIKAVQKVQRKEMELKALEDSL